MRSLFLIAVPAAFSLQLGCSDAPVEPSDGAGGQGGTPQGGSGEGGAGGAPLPPLEWGACDVEEWPDGYPTPPQAVECTTIDVPIDYADPSGPTMPLRVGRHPAMNAGTGKALFFLAGGPGGGALAQSGIMPSVLPELLEDFDFVYMEQRGTGGSGFLGCGPYPETEAQWRACAENKYAESPDLGHYLSVDGAHDLDLVRARLEYDRIYIRGGSYGTRLGLEYVRQHSDHVAAIVLDGVAPPDIDLFGADVGNFDHGIEMLTSDCDADPDCLFFSPSLIEDLMAVRASRAKAPRPISVEGMSFVEDEALYLQFLQSFIYTARARYHVPAAIHQAALGNPDGWYHLASTTFGVTIVDGGGQTTPEPSPVHAFRVAGNKVHLLGQDPVAPGLFATIMCAEFFPNSGGVDELEKIASGTTWPSTSIIDLAKTCSDWNVAPVSAELREPVSSDLPILLLSGRDDLQTLPANGDHALETLPNATHLVVPYSTHSQAYIPCIDDIMVAYFQNDGDMSAVDTSCVDELPHPGWSL